MSLDVYLHERRPCPHCGRLTKSDGWVYSANITHNLGRMASEAGIYEALWRPDEHGLETAAQVAAVLRPGLALLRAEPDRFRAFDSPNGWGLYKHFVPFVESYLTACDEHPTAAVEVSR